VFDAGKSTYVDETGKKETPYRLSSIEYVQEWKGFLVITSTEDDKNMFHGNKLWFIPDSLAVGGPSPITPVQFGNSVVKLRLKASA